MDYPSNSNRKKEENQKPKKDIEKVVSTEVIVQKKTVSDRFKNIFIGGEFKASMRYISAEVLLPAFRNMIVDATTKGIERVIYGESAPKRPRSSMQPRMSYNTPVDRSYSRFASPTPQTVSRNRRYDVSNIVLVSREEAETVLERLSDILGQYDVASVADLHQLVGLPSTWVDNKWGWSSLRYADVRQIREGFLLELPQVEPI
jgi:hypothetical protein